jgi:hypothetical protein
MRDDDAFWAARRVMAFSDALIRAVVKAGQFSDPRAEQYLGDVLIKRRDRIGRTYLTKINPVVDPALSASGLLTYGNAAVQHGFATTPRRYTAVWSAFDNATGDSTRIAETTSQEARMQAPAGLPAAPGSFVRIELSAEHPDFPAWSRPVQVYFRRQATGWMLVGLER